MDRQMVTREKDLLSELFMLVYMFVMSSSVYMPCRKVDDDLYNFIILRKKIHILLYKIYCPLNYISPKYALNWSYIRISKLCCCTTTSFLKIIYYY